MSDITYEELTHKMMFYCFILRTSDITYEELTLFVQVLFWNPMLDESDITYEELTHPIVMYA